MISAEVLKDIELRSADPSCAAARSCLDQYYAELARLFENGFDPAQAAYAGTGKQKPPSVYCVLAWRGSEALGCGFLQWQEGEAAVEIKRMWVAPEVRAMGLARIILAHLEAKSREMGFASVRLDTNRVLKNAQALYLRSGYAEIPRYSDNPYAHHWFGKLL